MLFLLTYIKSLRALCLLLAFTPYLWAIEDDSALKAVVDSNNSLGLQVYKKVSDTSMNMVMSPLGLSTSLAIAYSGSTGVTEAQMKRLLNYGALQQDVSKSFSDLLISLNIAAGSFSTDQTIRLNNSLWLQRTINPLEKFKTTVTQDFKASVENVDFFASIDAARLAINNWARQKSQGKFKELLGRETIDKTMRFLLLSTFSMHSRWLEPFDPALTKLAPFFPHPRKTITVPMMMRVGEYGFYRHADYLMIEVPCEKKRGQTAELSVIFVLPTLTYGLKELEDNLQAQEFNAILSRLEKRKVMLFMPHFKADSLLSFEPALQALGITQPFSIGAEFSLINEKQELKVDKILQKGTLSIDEKGVDFLGISSLQGLSKDAIGSSFPEVFNANHPFLFAVIEKKNFAILFIGHIVEP